MEKEHAKHSSLQPNHFFISMQHYLSVAVTSQVICMAVGIGEAWLMWPGRAEVVCVIGCLFALWGKKTVFGVYIYATIIYNLPNVLLEWQCQGTRHYLPLSTPGTPYFSNMKHSNMNFSLTLAHYFSESLRVHLLWRHLGQRTRQNASQKYDCCHEHEGHSP